jgi:hypothetical protein
MKPLLASELVAAIALVLPRTTAPDGGTSSDLDLPHFSGEALLYSAAAFSN